jgi:hypothetical protein
VDLRVNDGCDRLPDALYFSSNLTTTKRVLIEPIALHSSDQLRNVVFQK